MIQLCLNLTASKNAIAAGKTDCKIKFAPQMWATRPHLANIFEKLLDQKTFVCLRLVTGNSTVSFASQMWAARPHLGSIFEKLLHQKTFYLPAARFLQPI